MAIKGLTDKQRLPRLGKIHLGFRDEAKRGAPTATDYFVCPPEVQKVFGEKPTALRVRIPVLDPEKYASQFYKCYSQTRGLICKGDGETANCLIDTKTNKMATRDSENVEMKEILCRGRGCPLYEKKKCSEVMCLQVMIPEVPGLGVWQIDTSSINSIRNINSMGAILRAFCEQSGVGILSIPLTLVLEPLAVSPEGKKKTINVLNLRSDLVLDKLLKAPIPAQITTGEGTVEAEVEAPDESAPPPSEEAEVAEMPEDLWPQEGEGEVTFTTIKQLKERKLLCNWTDKDVWDWCVAAPRHWKIKRYEDLKPEQINEIVQYMIRNPK